MLIVKLSNIFYILPLRIKADKLVNMYDKLDIYDSILANNVDKKQCHPLFHHIE